MTATSDLIDIITTLPPGIHHPELLARRILANGWTHPNHHDQRHDDQRQQENLR